MLLIILCVLFVMTLFLWALSLLGGTPGGANWHPWLAFMACLILGLAVFLFGFGVVTWRAP